MARQQVILDVVGATEAHEILGVELQRISRWRKIGKLPPAYCDLNLSPVWVRADIERLRDTGSFEGYTEPPELSPLVSTSEAADILKVGKPQIARWRNRPNKRGPKFPEPATKIAAGPLWRRTDIEKWARKREQQKSIKENHASRHPTDDGAGTASAHAA